MATDLVLRAVLSPPEKARRRVSIIVGAATAALSLAGIWLRLEDGLALRVVLAATSALFGWLTMETAFAARDAAGAALRALGASIALGALSAIGPCAVMALREPNQPAVLLAIPFGALFGAVTGFAYGIPLSIVAAATWGHVTAATHDGADRAVRIASYWALLPVGLIALVLFGHDLHPVQTEWMSAREIEGQAVAAPLDMIAMGLASIVALVSFAIAGHRLTHRSRFIARVSSGADPQWGIREIGPHDPVDALPRLRHGWSVIEHKNEHAIYRAAATGEAVAIV